MKTVSIFLLALILVSCNSTKKDDSPTPLSFVHISKYSKMEPPRAQYAEVVDDNSQTDKMIRQQRLIIKTATVDCEVLNYDSAAAKLQAIVTPINGFIVSVTTHSTEQGRKSGTVVLRIPTASFDDMLKATSLLSTRVLSQSIEGNDVTEEYYDVSARLDNKRKIEARYQEILKSAKSVEDILAVEKNLGQIREDIESIEGRQKYLNDQVALSTLTINLSEPYKGIEYTREGFWHKVGRGFSDGIAGFGDVLGITIAYVIMSIPVIIVLVVIVIIIIPLIKLFRSRKPKNRETNGNN